MSSHLHQVEGSHSRKGLSLLEVLVACGILVIGLSSIAALLPAAGSRLAQASLEDRAGIAAANAYAEIVSRGLTSANVFVDKTKPAVFGKVLPNAGSTLLATGSTAGLIDPARGFLLEDELVYRPPTTADTPQNSFFGGGTGPREYKEAVCWGAMLSPTSYPAAAGVPTTLSIAVFKKEGQSAAVTIYASAAAAPPPRPGIFSFHQGDVDGTGAATTSHVRLAHESTRKQFLAGCSWCLLIPKPGTSRSPLWLKINSSWTSDGPTLADGTEDLTKRSSWLIPVVPDELLQQVPSQPSKYVIDFYRTVGSGFQSLTVIGFQHITRVDHYPLTLD